jgi:hypothetical protein
VAAKANAAVVGIATIIGIAVAVGASRFRNARCGRSSKV